MTVTNLVLCTVLLTTNMVPDREIVVTSHYRKGRLTSIEQTENEILVPHVTTNYIPQIPFGPYIRLTCEDVRDPRKWRLHENLILLGMRREDAQ